MEYCGGGTLQAQFIGTKVLTESMAAKYFYQIVTTLVYFHARGITHRDLKDKNILLAEDGTIKICDFGLSDFYSPGQKLTKYCGTQSNAAPEVFTLRVPYDPEKADVWSCGVMLYRMITKKLPFDGNSFKMMNTEFIRPD